MNKSESIASLAKALAAAQAVIGHAVKDSVNPAFKSRYADLHSIVEAARKALPQNGLSYSQLFAVSDSAAVVETVLLHESGEWISSEIAIPVKDKGPHAFGSAATYARRYALAAIIGLTQADDDGNAASLPAPVEDDILRAADALSGAKDRETLVSVWAPTWKKYKDDERAIKILQSAYDARKAQLSQVAA